MKRYIALGLVLALAAALLTGCAEPERDPAAMAVRIGQTVYTNEQVSIYRQIYLAQSQAAKAYAAAKGEAAGGAGNLPHAAMAQALAQMEVAAAEAQRLQLPVDYEAALQNARQQYSLYEDAAPDTPERAYYDAFHAALTQQGITRALYEEYAQTYCRLDAGMAALVEHYAEENGFDDVNSDDFAQAFSGYLKELVDKADIEYGP